MMAKKAWIVGQSPSLTVSEVGVLRYLLQFHWQNDELGHDMYDEVAFHNLVQALAPDLIDDPHDKAISFMFVRRHIDPVRTSLDEWLLKNMESLSEEDWLAGWAIVKEC